MECHKRYTLQPNPFLAFSLILLFLEIVITTGPSTLLTTSPSIITSSSQTIAPPSTGLPTRAIIGIAIGIVVLAVASLFLYVYRRRRRRPDTGVHPQPINGMAPVVEVESNNRLPSELHGGTSHDGPHQMDASSDVVSFYSVKD